jgi:hypothetical protein
VYELDGKVYRNVFHNGTIDVVEGGSFVKGETIFLSSLGLGLLGLLGMWAYSKVQEFIKVLVTSHVYVQLYLPGLYFFQIALLILVRTALIISFCTCFFEWQCCIENNNH